MHFVSIVLVVTIELIVLRDIIANILPQQHRSLVRPTPCHILDRVPASSQHDHGDVEAHHVAQAFPVSFYGQFEITNTVFREGVGAALKYDHVGPVETHYYVCDTVEDVQVVVVIHALL